MLSLMHGGANIDPSSAAAAAAASATTAAVSRTDNMSSAAKAGREDDGAMMDEGDEDSDIEDGLATSLGILKVDTDRGKSMYIGQEHWRTILADISEVKNYYVQHRKDLEKSYEKVRDSKPQTAKDGPTFLLGAPPATEAELRAELPPKSSVLTLCGRYFNSMDNAVSIIHAPSFHQQLKAHWQNPSKSPIMWLGLLYAVLTLAMLSYHKVGDEPPEWKGRTLELAAEYRLRTVQCLKSGDYTKPAEYTVETMVLYIFGEYSSRWDAEVALWLISSQITRLALRMGYHRDGKWFPSISPFQAVSRRSVRAPRELPRLTPNQEMRRRTWALVRMVDVMFSHQVSLPSMIYEHDCDTEVPSNLFDEEFGPDTKVLPPSRPVTEPTPVSYMITKIRLCLELGNILQATGRVKNQVHYDDILRFDARLRELREELPPHLKMRPLEGSHDHLALLIARFNIDILYLKIMCTLHRKYMSRARHNARYAHSRRSAVEASMEALKHLANLQRESQPGGRLQTIKWFVSSIVTKDFVLPAMLVVLDLHYDSSAAKQQQPGGRKDSQSQHFWTPEQRADMIRTLEVTQGIWAGLGDGNVEAMNACSILELMLERIKKPQQPGGGPGPAPADAASLRPTTCLFDGGVEAEVAAATAALQPEHSAAMTLGMLSGGVSPGIAAAAGGFGAAMQSPGGSAYPNPMDLGLGGEPAGLPDFSTGMFGGVGPASPFSTMFGALSGGDLGAPMEFTGGNFDWVSSSGFFFFTLII